MEQPLDNAGNKIDADEGVSRYTGYFIWLLVLCAAVMIHQQTGNVVLAVALPYVQAGWKSLRCGLWLLNADPVASRGRACFWFYLALACWKAAAAALTTVLIFVAIDGFTGRHPPMDKFVVTMLTLSGGVCLSTVIGLPAVVIALRSRVRIWAHPNVCESCGGDFGRVGDSGRRYYGFNHAIFVVATSLVFPILATATGLMIWSFAGEHPNEVRPVTAVLEFLLLFLGPLAMIPVYAFLSSRVIARTPADCWAPSTFLVSDRGTASDSHH